MGKFSDKFLNAFSAKDDDYDDEYYDDEEVVDEDDYSDDYDQPEEKSGGIFRKKAASDDAAPAQKINPFAKNNSAKQSQKAQKGNSEVCIFKPSSIEDAREITETLLQGKAVVINFEGLHVEISQRIIDFISGSCYALDGNLQKISNYIFIVTPGSVDISGDFQELFGSSDNSFDIAGFKSPLL